MESLATSKVLKANKSRIRLWNGVELQYHCPRPKNEPIKLLECLPESFRKGPLEVEIGPGKGEFIARRASRHPDRFFVGIERRMDRVRATTKKLSRVEEGDEGVNWVILREDARCFLASGLPKIDGLHLYQPDPWPKDRHHKHRFFRSPDALEWAKAIKTGGFFSFSTDHRDYFVEMIDIVKTWGILELTFAWEKNHWHGNAQTHFESIFLRQKKPVFKALFKRI